MVGPLFIFDWQPSPYDTEGDYAINNADGTPTLGGLAFSVSLPPIPGLSHRSSRRSARSR